MLGMASPGDVGESADFCFPAIASNISLSLRITMLSVVVTDSGKFATAAIAAAG
jgi:hypothetical protein